MSELIKYRYDFALLFDVTDGNPNGDPDAGNLPRVDAETGMGLVTDVCLKRKVRNFVQIVQNAQKPFDIYVKEKAVLGRAHVEAFKDLGIELGEGGKQKISNEMAEKLSDLNLPDGLSLVSDDNEDGETETFLNVAFDFDKKLLTDFWKENKDFASNNKDAKLFIDNLAKSVKSRKPKAEETEKGREWMCKNFYDIRTFGAVLALKSAPNCGQVRGPIQFTFGRSVDPVVALEHSITRMAVATEAEAEKQGGDNRTMGRKFTIPYGLYFSKGFISAHLAAQTGFNEDDLTLFWEALKNMFDHDHSAARGMMSTCKLIVFKHSTALGNASAHQLFDAIKIEKKDPNKPPRSFSDYSVSIDKASIPSGVEVIEMI
ncbi:MAG TPA: type I-C CRISPR-associated protein Cas7/Csd2 [Prolixibacteraceae bacterium]|nr:type I-C CRISPR-associated protein Cas7/Csd2 [Prolixibacteraceae bacterium]